MAMKLDRSFYTSGYNLIDPALYGEKEIAGFAAYYKFLAGKHYGMVFYGKQSKPFWHYSFKSLDALIVKVKNALESHKRSLDHKNKRKAEKKAFVSSLRVGDLMKSSWGYDQTNVDWFQVVEVKSPKTIVVREIQGRIVETGFMSGKAYPVKDDFIGEPMLKRVGEGDHISLSSFSSARKVDWVDMEKTGAYVSWYA